MMVEVDPTMPTSPQKRSPPRDRPQSQSHVRGRHATPASFLSSFHHPSFRNGLGPCLVPLSFHSLWLRLRLRLRLPYPFENLSLTLPQVTSGHHVNVAPSTPLPSEECRTCLRARLRFDWHKPTDSGLQTVCAPRATTPPHRVDLRLQCYPPSCLCPVSTWSCFFFNAQTPKL